MWRIIPKMSEEHTQRAKGASLRRSPLSASCSPRLLCAALETVTDSSATSCGSSRYTRSAVRPASHRRIDEPPSAMAPSPPSLRLFVGTFNLGNAPPELCFAEHFAALGEGCDLVVFGLQEAHYSTADPLDPQAVAAHVHRRAPVGGASSGGSWGARLAQGACAVGGAAAGAALLASTLPLALAGGLLGGACAAFASRKVTDEVECRAHALALLHASLGTDEYTLLVAESLLQTRVAVFFRNAAFPAGAPCEARAWTLDVGGPVPGLPTKGAVLVSLLLGKDGPRVAFAACHLAAHPGPSQAALRDRQLAQVLRSGDLCAQHSHVFVLGDLNYRLDGAALAIATTLPAMPAAAREMDTEQEQEHRAWGAVVRAVSEGRWAELAAVDELSRARAEGRALPDFTEGPLLFAPTYKLQRGAPAVQAPPPPPPPAAAAKGGRRRGDAGGPSAAAQPPTPVYSSKRVPSWTDRVLWWSSSERKGALQLTSYRPCPAVTTSDHTPLTATFTVRL